MEQVREYQRKIILKSFALFSTVSIILVVSTDIGNWKGFLAGYVLSVTNFILLGIDIRKITVLQKSKYMSILLVRYFLRYAVLGLAIYVAFLYNINIIAFVGGLFLIQATLIVDTYLQKS